MRSGRSWPKQPAGDRLGGSIVDTAETLSRYPFKGRVAPELANIGVSEYRQPIVEAYRIIYRVRDETIDILMVVDSRRDLASLLMERLLRS